MKLGWSNYEESAVAWIADDGDEGAIVGQDFHDAALAQRLDVARKQAASGDDDAREDIEYLVVEIAAKKWVAERPYGPDVGSHTGVRLPDAPKKVAADYMRALKSALARAHDDTPWPEWAVKAQAAGWKSPKGWKP